MDAAQGGAVSKIPETSWLLTAFPKANFTHTRTCDLMSEIYVLYTY